MDDYAMMMTARVLLLFLRTYIIMWILVVFRYCVYDF